MAGKRLIVGSSFMFLDVRSCARVHEFVLETFARARATPFSLADSDPDSNDAAAPTISPLRPEH